MKTDNEIIAEFMGLQVYQTWEEMRAVPINDLKAWALPDHLGYHYSWDRLMPVVERIEDMELGGGQIKFIIDRNRVQVLCSGVEYFWNSGTTSQDKIQTVFDAVIEFIKWYNENHG